MKRLGVFRQHRDPHLHLGRHPVDCVAARLPATARHAVVHAARLAGLLPAGVLLVVVLFWHGTDASVSAVDSYVEPRRIALAAFKEGTDLDGMVYRARHDNGELCFALFDRVQETDLAPSDRKLFSKHRVKLDGLMEKYGAVFDRSPPVPPP